jgi:hypothetical protein
MFAYSGRQTFVITAQAVSIRPKRQAHKKQWKGWGMKRRSGLGGENKRKKPPQFKARR